MEWKEFDFVRFLLIIICVHSLHSLLRSAFTLLSRVPFATNRQFNWCCNYFFSALANVNCINTRTKSCQMAVSNYTEICIRTQRAVHAHSMQLPSGLMQHLIVAHTHRCTLKRPLFKWKTTSHSTIIH